MIHSCRRKALLHAPPADHRPARCRRGLKTKGMSCSPVRQRPIPLSLVNLSTSHAPCLGSFFGFAGLAWLRSRVSPTSTRSCGPFSIPSRWAATLPLISVAGTELAAIALEFVVERPGLRHLGSVIDEEGQEDRVRFPGRRPLHL